MILRPIARSPVRQAARTPLARAAGAAAAAQPLRFTSSSNYATTSFRTLDGTRLHHKSRQAAWFGAGDRSDLVLAFKNWRLDLTGVVLNGNAFTIVQLAVECNGIVQPAYFGGVRNRTVAAGEAKVLADALLPAQFGLTEFAVGTQYWIRVHISVTTSGHAFPEGPNYEDARGGTFPDWVGWAYDPAVNTSTGAIDATGPIGLGAGGGDGRHVLSVISLGRFVSGDPATWAGFGDSIMAMSSDDLAGLGYAGFFARSLVNETFNGGYGAGMAFGVSGATPNMWLTGSNIAHAQEFWGYAKYGVEEFGTNNFYFGDSLATTQAQVQGMWALMRSAGMTEIIRTAILPRTDSTDNWTTPGNQTPVSADFQAGGDAALFNTWLSTQIGPTGVSVVLPLTSVRDGGDAWKWATNGTPFWMCDVLGTHPQNVGHALVGTDLRTAMAGFP